MKNILITGASSGIGFEIAKLYHSYGYKVIAIARDLQKMEALAKIGIDVYSVDLNQIDSCKISFEQINEKYNHIDIAILSAGNCEYIDPQKFEAKLFERVFSANVFTMANTIEFILPMLRKSLNPHLVGIASLAYYIPFTRASAYGASKAAVNYMLDSLAIDLDSENILVTVVNPGFVKTPLTDKNNFNMPFMVDAKTSAHIIYQGIKKRKIEIHFPYKLSWIIKFISLLPRRWNRKVGLILARK